MKLLLRRLAWSLFVVWGVVSVAFVIDEVIPGDPARLAAGPQASAADVARVREHLGLGRPPAVGYARFWARLVHPGPVPSPDGTADPDHASCRVVASVGSCALHLDLGKSFQMGMPVVDVVGPRIGRTLTLAVAGISLQVFFGASAGVFAALRRGSWIDRAVVGSTVLGASLPTFVVALALQYVLAYQLRWLPLDGFGETLAEHLGCLVLPALTLGVYGAAYYTRIIRDEVRGALDTDWMRTARAKGLSLPRAVALHALPNALVPVITAVGLDLGALMGGAVVTETVFRWPGLGDLGVRATLSRDGPVVMACVIVTAVAVVASNVVADLLCAALDPRMARGRP